MAKDKEKDQEGKVTKAKAASKSPAKKSVSAKATKTAKADAAPTDKKAPKKSGEKVAKKPLLPRTFFAKKNEGPVGWRVVDAAGLPLGRLSSYVATALMGKDKPSYTRSADTGDFVVVINASKIVLTGKKLEDKVYQYHTNYPGGLKTLHAKDVLEKNPDRLVKYAVYGMLPKGHMGRKWFKKLKVYAGADHPHTAQQPQVAKLPDLGFWQRG